MANISDATEETITHWRYNNITRRSLSTDGGTPRKQNFFDYELHSEDFIQHRSKNGVEYDSSYKGRFWTGLDVDIYQGRDLPKFHSRRNAGELLPFTRYLKVIHSLDVTGNSENWNTRPNGDVYHYWCTAEKGGDLPQLFVSDPAGGYEPFDTYIPGKSYDLLTLRGIDPLVYVQKSASQIYSRGWDASTFFLELHKSLDLISSSLRRVRDLLRAYQKETAKGSAKAANLLLKADPSLDEWLSVRYGWRLLLYDIQDIAAAIGQTEGKLRERQSQRSGISQQWEDDLSFVYTQPGVFTNDYTDIRSNDFSVRGRVITDFLPATVSVNPFVTYWEVIPFSFVIDWLINIGRSITTLSFLILNDRYTACWGISHKVERQASLVTTALDTRVFNSYQTVSQSYEVYYRVPCLIPKLPLLKTNFSAAKFVDLVALIDGLIRGVVLYY